MCGHLIRCKRKRKRKQKPSPRNGPPDTRAYGGVKSLLRAWDRHGVSGADKVTIATVAPIMASEDSKAAIKAYGTRGEGRVKLTFLGR